MGKKFPRLLPYRANKKISSRFIKNLDVKSKAKKLFEDNKGELSPWPQGRKELIKQAIKKCLL